jgi:hypothetical protein
MQSGRRYTRYADDAVVMFLGALPNEQPDLVEPNRIRQYLGNEAVPSVVLGGMECPFRGMEFLPPE